MRKIAVISDVHGNVHALKAVLADAKAAGCTDFWFLGDLFVPGPGAHDLLELLDQAPISTYLRGNWEDGFLETVDGKIDPTDPSDIYEALIDDYVASQLTPAEIQRIRDLPMVTTKTVEGLRFQLTHNTPAKNFGRTLQPTGHQADFDQLAGNQADVVLYGHVHHQLFRQSTAGQLIINPGTVGMPFPHWSRFAADLRAQYAIVTTHGLAMPDVAFRKVTYDVAAEIALAKQRALPYLDLYIDQLKNGNVYTHELDTLAHVTQASGYQKKLTALLAKHHR